VNYGGELLFCRQLAQCAIARVRRRVKTRAAGTFSSKVTTRSFIGLSHIRLLRTNHEQNIATFLCYLVGRLRRAGISSASARCRIYDEGTNPGCIL